MSRQSRRVTRQRDPARRRCVRPCPRFERLSPFFLQESDSDGSRRRLRPPSTSQSQQQQTKSCLVLFIGLGIAILLVSLGGYALLRYFNRSSSGSAGGVQIVTETVNLPGGGIATTTVWVTQPAATGDAGNSAPATSTGSSPGGSTGAGSSGSSGGSDKQPGISRKCVFSRCLARELRGLTRLYLHSNIGIGFLPECVSLKFRRR